MEGKPDEVASVRTSNTDQEKIFEDICENLNLDKETRNKAWELLSGLPPKSQTEQVCISSTIEHVHNSTHVDQPQPLILFPTQERYLYYMVACALYVAGRGTDSAQGNGVSLSQLLRAANIRYVSSKKQISYSFVLFLPSFHFVILNVKYNQH